MAYSSAFTDYQQRFRSLSSLLRLALGSSDPSLASASSKGSIVLAAAAAERFMNDALRQACQRIRIERYDRLSEGQQAYLCTQIARRVAVFDSGANEVRVFTLERRLKLIAAVGECAKAFQNPSAWVHMADFGMFMDGAAAPAKVSAVLKDFDPQRKEFFDILDRKPMGKAPYIRALSELVDARHNAAHAKSATDPSPSDAKTWIVSSFWLMRAIENHLSELSPIQ